MMGGRRPASGAGSYFNASSNPRVAATGLLKAYQFQYFRLLHKGLLMPWLMILRILRRRQIKYGKMITLAEILFIE